ncbi:T9SS type B sorting domain-containing protein [Zobellia sp.]|nr:T9SS type B sorting domain-containing protein [Zobellia sp.]
MKFFFTLIIVLSCFSAISQQANDCIDAIVVCGNSNISSNATGFGQQELSPDTNPCVNQEVNSLWVSVSIAVSGSLAFTIRPRDNDLEVDYDFFIFGPNSNCQNLGSPIRCSTTNPNQASLSSNITGLSNTALDQNEGPGPNGDSFVSSIPVTAGEQYYILVDRPNGDGGFDLEWTGTAGFLPSPNVTQPNDIEVCSSGSNTAADLTENETKITSSSTADILYYTSYNNAFDHINAITDPTQYTYNGTENTIYVRVTNPNGCFEIVDFDIHAALFDTPPNLGYSTCDEDGDGQADFSVDDISIDAENAISNSAAYDLTLHPNENAAITNTAQIIGTVFSSASTTIYARVSATSNNFCYITYPISLTVNSSSLPASADLIQCDIDEDNSLDGITNMDLNQSFPNLDPTSITYYETDADRIANNPIWNPNNYINTTPFNTTVYYRIANSDCDSLGEIAIEVKPTTVSLNTISPVMACADNPEDEFPESTFDLESIRQNTYAGMDVAFYKSLEDASLEQNPLDGNYRTSSTFLYTRLETNNQCNSVEEIEFIVNNLPEVTLEDSYEVCASGEPLLIDAPDGFDGYSWLKTDNGIPLEISTNQQVTITEPGNYSLEVEIQYQNNNQTSSCINYADFLVIPSTPVVIENMDIEQFSNSSTVTIEVRGDSDYEYSLDGETYQNEPRFDNVEAGFYTVFVRDKNGCGTSQKDISVIGFPKFFTPNGDGANDTWQITGSSTNFDNQAITIYDRYGKLIKQISSNSIGWDGTMNGQPLPSSDYWFRLTLTNGKEYKGHFSLKR